jgi:hypothetical protein
MQHALDAPSMPRFFAAWVGKRKSRFSRVRLPQHLNPKNIAPFYMGIN